MQTSARYAGTDAAATRGQYPLEPGFRVGRIRGRSSVRVLAVIDDYTKECLGLTADTSLPGVRVARELDGLIERYGRPQTIVSDNGTELTSRAILKWQNETGIAWHYIQPGKPPQNAFVEAFNG